MEPDDGPLEAAAPSLYPRHQATTTKLPDSTLAGASALPTHKLVAANRIRLVVSTLWR